MAQIVNKLNLNRVPQLVDNHSLIFAKNVRLSANGFSPDFGFDEIGKPPFKGGIDHNLVGVIPYNTKFYTLWHHYPVDSEDTADSVIFEYDEQNTNHWKEIKTAWKYSGITSDSTTIDGYCTINLNGDIILTIAENGGDKNIPLKSINITKAETEPDDYDESLYTQAPIVPLINLSFVEYYKNVIPAGTYQFFIRYEIRDKFYTNWFPASKELFAGFSKTQLTQQGSVKYIDLSVDSDKSFVLQVDKVVTSNDKFFKSFQIGFILAHDDEVYARAYKHYSLDVSTIYFDYDTEYIEEIDVTELLESPYNIYNVKNLTSFKNKLYISNYIESNFNPIINIADYKIQIDIRQHANTVISKIGNDPVTLVTTNNRQYITEITKSVSNDTKSIQDIVNSLISGASHWINSTIESDGLIYKSAERHIKLEIIKSIDTEIKPDPIPGGEVIDGGDNVGTLNPTYGYEFGQCQLRIDGDTNYTTYDSIGAALNAMKADIYGIGLDGKIVRSNLTTTFTGGDIKYLYKKSDETKECSLSFTFTVNANDIHINYTLNSEYSLIPHQGYNFYIHFVRANGEATNGFLINTNGPIIIEEPKLTSAQINNNDIPALYPVFTIENGIPEGYVAYFISILHVENKVAQLFDIKDLYVTGDASTNPTCADCLEFDTRLYTALRDIPVKYLGNEYEVDYRPSYDTEYLPTFGSSGKCIFKTKIEDISGSKIAFAVLPYSVNTEYAQLTKCTPYITPNNLVNNVYDNYNNLNLLGYVCRVVKLDDNHNYYFAGSDIYNKTTSKTNNNIYNINLTAVGDKSNLWTQYKRGTEWSVYSNYNLNYLSLRTNYSPRVITKEFDIEGEVDNNTKKSVLLYAQESLNLSEVYELKSMFYSYTRKTYYPFDLNNVLIKFDNTIRSSELNGDEDIVNMFKFKSTDYYNVPTDKGIIVNLVAVGDNILVHTQDSIYKFSGYNSLSAAGGEDVQVKESEPFDTGIQELFGSEFGYAGLQNKKHQVLSEIGYTFYDSDGQRIYYYTGNANIKVISDDVSKLFKYKPLKDIYFADDYYNNRVFVCLDFGDGKYATLTYDFTAKCFISLHDFRFDWAFKTKTKCYFVTPERNNIYRVSDTLIADYPSAFSFEDKLYPTGANKECMIDVIYNDNFESIKTLNAISWVCNEVKDFLEEATDNATEDMLVAEEWFDHKHSYKGEVLRLYSDSVKTPAIDISDKTNDKSIQQVSSYDRPRYNLGKWTFNYFRNILNRDEDPTHPRVFGGQDTLLYGKYFVARFIFNRTTNFKIEDVTFEISNDYNV